MPNQRPFFSNFLAAFRAHSAIQGKTASSASPSSQQAHTPHSTSQTPASQPRTITTTTKHPSGATTTALTSLHSPRTHSTSPLSTSPGTSTSPGSETPIYGPHQQPHQSHQTHQTHHAHHQTQTGQNPTQPRYISSSRGRRESDSSSEGFRDVLGAEKWYIGGRTAGGEEKYFKLGVIKRQRSGDRLSLDRLSL